jgi:uncharacterized protein (DUF58 family)
VTEKPLARRTESLDWAKLATLRLRARAVADGVYAGMHASRKRGAGVEFGGHRPYVPGDDLRLLDRRAMARHDKPFLRELETETDRALRLLVDASASMGFRGARAKVSKLDFVAVLAAALTRIALASGDPVGLDYLGGESVRPVAPSSSGEAFERVLASLEAARAAKDVSQDRAALDRALAPIARRARRGTVIVLFSDLVDVHEETLRRYSALATGGRTLLAVRVLSPEEATFPYEGPVRLRAIEGSQEIETDPLAVRQGYLSALAAIEEAWATRLAARGGRLVTATTSDDPVVVVRSILRAAAEGTR